MSFHRIIPVLLYSNGSIVRSERFTRHQPVGRLKYQFERYLDWGVDEILILDISANPSEQSRQSFLDQIKALTRRCFVPLTVGGGIRSLSDVRKLLELGVDRIVINTPALKDIGFITEASQVVGSQAVIVSIDVSRNKTELRIKNRHVAKSADIDLLDYCCRVQEAGAGELLINSMSFDGMGRGYDLDLIRLVADTVNIPIIACGGAGVPEDLARAIVEGGATSAAAGNLFLFSELSYQAVKQVVHSVGVGVRMPSPHLSEAFLNLG